MAENDRTTSVRLYRILSDVFGSEDAVKLRRTIYSALEMISLKGYQVIPSGSKAEGLELEGSDYDLMFLVIKARVYETLSDITMVDNTASIIMDYDNTKLGFTRLILPNKEFSYIKNLSTFCLSYGGVQYISSASIRDLGANPSGVPHGPCIMYKGDLEHEYLICFRCKEWISLVSPWATRSRGSWPSTQLIHDITQYGVLFVPVGCKTSKYEDLEWRISFSIAEKQLIHSFTHAQFLCYAMMKTLLSDIIKKQHKELLCSYFIKTIMFWLSEENDSDFWTPNNLIHCYMTCLKRLIYCVQYRICLHYFIPEINFFEDRFSDSEQKNLLKSLYAVYFQGWKALLHTETVSNFIQKVNLNNRTRCDLRNDTFLTSSVLPPLYHIRHYLFLANSKYILPLIKYTSLSTKRVLLYVNSLQRHGQVPSNETLEVSSGNKKLYNQYKSILPDFLLSTKHDCVSGWCLLASLYYKLKLYNRCNHIVGDCLSKCTPDKILMRIDHHIHLPQHIHNLVSKSRYFTSMLQHFFLGSIFLYSVSLLPAELLIFEPNISNDELICFPAVVYLHFLDFLCAHHQKQYTAKKNAFRNLQNTVKEEYFILNDPLMTIAVRILDIAYNMLHLT